MTKQTYASVTEVICQCGHMEELARSSNTPIRFNAEFNEYHIEYGTPEGGTASIFVHHCIFCGGAMPPSKRDLLFGSIPDAEKARLLKLVSASKTVDELIRVIGSPDFDDPILVDSRSATSKGPGSASLPTRTLTYCGLSAVANVHVSVGGDGSIQVMVVPKRKPL